MSKKYIGQQDNQNFIYPNNNLAEYDIEIIHDINDNNITGTTSGLTITLTGSNLNVVFSYVWDLNNGERYINDANELSYLSVHMMDSSNLYYKPFRCISGYTTTGITATTISGSTSILVTPAMLGVASFTGGTYNLEFRFIGHRNIYPIGQSYTVAAVTPTPTPTITLTPTPSPTFGSTPTPTITPTITPSTGSVSYAYYEVLRYTCFPCTVDVYKTARTVSTTTLTTFYYYNNGDGYVYKVTGYAAGPAYDVDLDGSATQGTDCNGTCAI
jgi:hypothetical protein